MREPLHKPREPRDLSFRRARWVALGLVLSAGIAACDGCGKKDAQDGDGKGGGDEGAAKELEHGLTPEQAGQVVAKIGDTTITLGQFAERLASQSPYLRARYNSPERRREFLDNMVRFELLALEAQKRGLDKEEEVQRVRHQMMVQQMMKELFDEKGVKLSDITDEEIKAYYEEHKAEFEKPAQRRASHILFKDKAQAQAVLKQLVAAPKDMQLFRDLAKKHNIDPKTKDRFGDLRFFSLDATPEEEPDAPAVPLRQAAFKLENTGDVYPELIETDQGVHVLKLTGERAALNRSLEDARRLIQNRLWRKRREEAIETFVGDLRKKAEVKENLDLLSEVEVDLESAPTGAAAEGSRAGRAQDSIDEAIEEGPAEQ